ncbi:zeta toxin family protein [Streptomyces mayteni]
MSEREVVPVVLPAETNRQVLDHLILPAWTSGAVSQEQPVVVFVSGPPGAGKTEAADLVEAALSRRGRPVRVGRDLYKRAHPEYERLLAEDVRTAGVRVRPDTAGWQFGVEERVRDLGLDAVVETALADPDEVRATAAAYRASGHRIEVAAVAAPMARTQLGIVDRFLEELAAGGGRYVSWENHDTCSRALARTLAMVEAEGLADRVMVVQRGMEVLYDNELVDGAWRRRPAAGQTVERERARWWSARETAQFRQALAITDRRVHSGALDEDRRLAVQRDVERAAAFAEPVRRVAQPIPEPPGVAYHGLTAEEHQWIYDKLIVPTLRAITPQERPVVVYVMAQPGAGKTRMGRLVRRSLRGRPMWIMGDNFKAAHPDYLRLLREEPRTAGARIRTDYKAWQRMVEARVRAGRGDAVIEIAPGDVDEFVESAELFHDAGHMVHLVVIGARAADSRQGTAARFAWASRKGLPGRFTTRAGHDRCFAAVAEAVRAAEDGSVVDSVTVVRRDGTAVYRNERLPDARWRRCPAGAGVVVAEQHRPYTRQEATEFLALQRRLRRELPQYRDELLDITRLAAPLLPFDMRPLRLGRPAAPAFLPLPATAGYSSPSALRRAA